MGRKACPRHAVRTLMFSPLLWRENRAKDSAEGAAKVGKDIKGGRHETGIPVAPFGDVTP